MLVVWEWMKLMFTVRQPILGQYYSRWVGLLLMTNPVVFTVVSPLPLMQRYDWQRHLPHDHGHLTQPSTPGLLPYLVMSMITAPNDTMSTGHVIPSYGPNFTDWCITLHNCSTLIWYVGNTSLSMTGCLKPLPVYTCLEWCIFNGVYNGVVYRHNICRWRC